MVWVSMILWSFLHPELSLTWVNLSEEASKQASYKEVPRGVKCLFIIKSGF